MILGIIFKFGDLRRRFLYNFGNPDIIISIQPELNAVAGILKAWFRVPIYSIIIDLVAHGLWVDENIEYTKHNRIGDHIWYISSVDKFKSHYPEWEYTKDLKSIIDEIYQFQSNLYKSK